MDTTKADKSAVQQTKKDTPPRLISVELHNQWIKMTEWGDSKVIAELLGVSGPTASKALKYGYVRSSDHIDRINLFFETRKNQREAADKERLSKLQTKLK